MRTVFRLWLTVPVLVAALTTATRGAPVYQAPLVKCQSCKNIDQHIKDLRHDIAMSRDYIACAQTAIKWMEYRASWEYQVIYDAYLTRAELDDAARLVDEYKQHQEGERKKIVQWQDDIRSLQRIQNFCRNCPITQFVMYPR